MLKDTSSVAGMSNAKVATKKSALGKSILLLYVEIKLKISRIRHTRGPSPGLAKIAFKTGKKRRHRKLF